jgi:hypothetical protein
MTFDWNRIKKHIHVDWEIIWSWKGKLFVILGFCFWLPYRYPSVGSPAGPQGKYNHEQRIMNSIFGREEGEFQVVIPFLRYTIVWGGDGYRELELGWKVANAGMYKDS